MPAAGAILVFFWHPQVAKLRRTVIVFDAAGLALFTVTGTRLALEAGLGAAGASVLGLLTGIGGGVVRDVLLRQIPLVLQRGELYAIVALVGAALVCLGRAIHVLNLGWSIGTVLVVFGLRIVAVRRHWQAPQPRHVEDQAGA